MKKIALFENADKSQAVRCAIDAAHYLHKVGAEIYVRPELFAVCDEDTKKLVHERTIKEFEKYADMIISFGGDGTILTAARETINSDLPIMGVNVGKLGFLAEYNTDRLEQSLQDVLNGVYRLVDRAILETTVDGRKYYALNDFVIEKNDNSKMITLAAYSDDHYVGDYRADGVIIATPTGSTAYSLSCNGPIIAPSTPVLCITPISPHTLTLRPLVVPDTNEIRFRLDTPNCEAILVADGFTVKLIKYGEEVIVKLSESKVKLIKPEKSTYYDVLRRKLLWGANALNESVK